MGAIRSKKANLVQLNIAVLLWGGTAMFAKGIALPVSHIICLRSMIGAATLAAVILAVRKPVRVKKPSHLILMGTLGLLLCFHWLTYFKSLQVSTAAVAILSLHTYPVFTVLVEPFVFHEKLRKSDIALALVIFVGILIMSPKLSLSDSTTQGILLGVLSGLFFMTRNLINRKYVDEYPSSSLMFWQMLVTGVVLIPWLFAGEAVYPPRTLWLLLLLGVVFTAIPQTLFAASFKTLSAKTVGIISTLLPLYGAILGYYIHGERLELRTVAGGTIVLAGIFIETARTVTASPPQPNFMPNQTVIR